MSAEDETDIVVVIRVLRMLDRIRVGLPTGPEAAHDIEIESTALAAAAAGFFRDVGAEGELADTLAHRFGWPNGGELACFLRDGVATGAKH